MQNSFVSKREQRLWSLAAMVVVVIYATLGLASTLVGMVDEEILAGLFLLALILVGLTILTQGLKTIPSGAEIGIFIGVATVYLLLCIRLAIPERSHLLEFGVLAVLIFEALNEGKDHGRAIRYPALIAFLLTSLFGLVDELIQLALPERVFDWEDILFNTLAALTAVVGMVGLRWSRARSRVRAEDK